MICLNCEKPVELNGDYVETTKAFQNQNWHKLPKGL